MNNPAFFQVADSYITSQIIRGQLQTQLLVKLVDLNKFCPQMYTKETKIALEQALADKKKGVYYSEENLVDQEIFDELKN